MDSSSGSRIRWRKVNHTGRLANLEVPTSSNKSPSLVTDGSEGDLSGILIEFKKNDAMKMVEMLTRSGDFSGHTVIVSWSHQQLPALAAALGVPKHQVPPKWGKRYDVTWVLEPVGFTKASSTTSSRPHMKLTQLHNGLFMAIRTQSLMSRTDFNTILKTFSQLMMRTRIER
ncbi:hypothetical protein BC829DRAFT_431916 [Chytridium lagenaria]|nr:hypothetical protein BC829DRAFT_431916 [Chytridium lagenaria]